MDFAPEPKLRDYGSRFAPDIFCKVLHQASPDALVLMFKQEVDRIDFSIIFGDRLAQFSATNKAQSTPVSSAIRKCASDSVSCLFHNSVRAA